jgi:hypothetical protein
MTNDSKPFRLARPRLWTALGTLAAAGLVAGAPAASAADSHHEAGKHAASVLIAASGEGENSGSAEGGEREAAKGDESEDAMSGEGGEGEGGARRPTEADFLASVAFMEGHLRAGMKLYQTGDLEAAKTHMGHPIKEKYDAVAETLEDRGFGDLKADIAALADAAENEEPAADMEARFDKVAARIDAIEDASPGGKAAGLMSLAKLTRIAADEYAVATEGGRISNLHEYQDAWGFLRVVEDEAQAYAGDDDAKVATAGRKILEQVRMLDKAFGDIQGEGDMTMDASLLYGAAARMEIAALAVK